MRGVPNLNFHSFDKTAMVLRALGVEVFSPAEMDREEGLTPDKPPKPLYTYLLRDFAAIDKADAIVLIDGYYKNGKVAKSWLESNGANAELAHALLAGKEVYEERVDQIWGPKYVRWQGQA